MVLDGELVTILQQRQTVNALCVVEWLLSSSRFSLHLLPSDPRMGLAASFSAKKTPSEPGDSKQPDGNQSQ